MEQLALFQGTAFDQGGPSWHTLPEVEQADRFLNEAAIAVLGLCGDKGQEELGQSLSFAFLAVAQVIREEREMSDSLAAYLAYLLKGDPFCDNHALDLLMSWQKRRKPTTY